MLGAELVLREPTERYRVYVRDATATAVQRDESLPDGPVLLERSVRDLLPIEPVLLERPVREFLPDGPVLLRLWWSVPGLLPGGPVLLPVWLRKGLRR